MNKCVLIQLKTLFTYRFAISVLKLNFVVPLIFETLITFDLKNYIAHHGYLQLLDMLH